jgi:hypothetical protein
MTELTYSLLLSLLDDPELSVQEQALNLLRNLTANKSSQQEEVLDKVLNGLGTAALRSLLEQKLASPFAEILNQVGG